MNALKLAALTALFPLTAQAQGITLTVEGLRNDQGHVLVGVFDTAPAFENLDFDQVVEYAEIPAAAGQVTHAFPDLTGGPYAIFLFHDENDDQDLNHSLTAYLEGMGASGATSPDDEPGFAEAAVYPGAVRVIVHYDQ